MSQIVIELEELPDLPSRLDRIQNAARALAEVPLEWLGPQGSEIADVEWFILGAIKRTASLAYGFCDMIRAKNTLSAAALLRLQIDTAMRVHGLFLIDDPVDAGEKLMAGVRYDKLVSRSGERLRDVLLHTSLSKVQPWVSAAYTDASDHVHLSGQHMKTSIGAVINNMIFFNLNGVEPQRKDEDYYHLADTFFIAVDLTAKLIRDFVEAHPGPKVRPPGWKNG